MAWSLTRLGHGVDARVDHDSNPFPLDGTAAADICAIRLARLAAVGNRCAR